MSTCVTETAAPPRFHLGLHSADLPRSVRFYRVLLGVEPVKHLPDYARFELDRPALAIGLYPNSQPPGGSLNHVGIRFPDSQALVAVQRRLEEAGIATQRQEGVECCYSRQTKFWVTDPDRVLWEIYTKHEDVEHSGFDDAPVVVPAVLKSWQHRLTDPAPVRIPHDDASLDEVQFEGTFNAALGAEQLTALAAEAHRVLKPGGQVSVHGLVADRPFPGTPDLPGLASMVRSVPVEAEPVECLRQAGFANLFFEKLSDVHCFQVSGVELRQAKLLGWKATEASDQTVMYKGPFEEVASDCGQMFCRGEAVRVSGQLAGALRAGPLVGQFSFLQSAQ